MTVSCLSISLLLHKAPETFLTANTRAGGVFSLPLEAQLLWEHQRGYIHAGMVEQEGGEVSGQQSVQDTAGPLKTSRFTRSVFFGGPSPFWPSGCTGLPDWQQAGRKLINSA